MVIINSKVLFSSIYYANHEFNANLAEIFVPGFLEKFCHG